MKHIFTAVVLLVGGSFGICASESVGHKPRLTKRADIEKSFPKLAGMLASIDGKSMLTLYEGLPHQMWDREQLAFELKNKESITRFGFPFYKTPNPVSEADTKLLSEALKAQEAFVRYQGFKLCGGFHPDFALVWTQEGKVPVEIHVCLGCGEIKAYTDGVEVYCDIMNALPRIEEVLKAYQIQRPDPKPKKVNTSDDPFGFENDKEEEGAAEQSATASETE